MANLNKNQHKLFCFNLPDNITFDDQLKELKGPLGSLVLNLSESDYIYKENQFFFINSRIKKCLNQHIVGLTYGHKIEVELVGIGYRCELKNESFLDLKLGFSHSILLEVPPTIEVFVENEKLIVFYGKEYAFLKNFTSKLINLRKMNLFTGQGLKFKESPLIIKKNKKR